MKYLTERHKRGELAKRTLPSMRHALTSLDRSFGNRSITQLTPRAIERWLETIGHLAPSSRRAMLSTVRTFCRWLVEQGQITADPTASIQPIRQPRSVPRALNASDVARLLRAAPDQRARSILALMVGCGLRCVEVARLNVTDYDNDRGTITVVGKGQHERVLPVPVMVAVEVTRYLATVGVVSGPLIRSNDHTRHRLRAQTISSYVSRWMGDAGLKSARWDGRSAHALRHTCASDVLDRGAQLTVVQAMLGHQHLSTTSIYLRRANLGQMRAAMEGRTYAA